MCSSSTVKPRWGVSLSVMSRRAETSLTVSTSKDKRCEAACLSAYHMWSLQRAACIRSTASASRPKTATHVSAPLSPDCMAPCRPHGRFLFVRHSCFQFGLQLIISCFEFEHVCLCDTVFVSVVQLLWEILSVLLPLFCISDCFVSILVFAIESHKVPQRDILSLHSQLFCLPSVLMSPFVSAQVSQRHKAQIQQPQV